MFKEAFISYPYSSITDILNKFLNGESERLLNVLVNHDIIMIKQNIKKAYSAHSEDDLWSALNGSSHALDKLIKAEVNIKKENIKKQLRTIIDECKCVNSTLQSLGLDDYPCDLLFMSSPPRMEALKQLPIRSKAAYVRSSKALHYVDISRNQCIEIILADESMRAFYTKFK